MKAAVATRTGSPSVLEIKEVPRPSIGANEMLVRVRAIGLNFADLLGRLGVYPGIPKPPYIPGMELAGVVEEVGDDVTRFRVGDRVMAYTFIGSHAEFAAVPETSATLMPEQMSFKEGAAFLVTSLTAYHSLVTLANVRPKEKLLLHAAAGGVGLVSIQMAKYFGMEVFATAGTNEKLEAAHAHGADHLINYSKERFDNKVREMTDGYGVDVVMDSVGGKVFKPGWNLLAPMGRYILYGFAAAVSDRRLNPLRALLAFLSVPRLSPPSMINRNVGLLCFNLSKLTHKLEYLRSCELALRNLYEKGAFRPVVGKVFPFDQIREAHEYVQSRRSIGKVVVIISD